MPPPFKLDTQLFAASGAEVRLLSSTISVKPTALLAIYCPLTSHSHVAARGEASLQPSSYYPSEHTYISNHGMRRRRSNKYTLKRKDGGIGYNLKMARATRLM
jgi:hypothetical protein